LARVSFGDSSRVIGKIPSAGKSPPISGAS